jgi:hypothetical protein
MAAASDQRSIGSGYSKATPFWARHSYKNTIQEVYKEPL